jgi:hypothetical protein
MDSGSAPRGASRNDEGCCAAFATEINDVFQNKDPGIAAGVLHFVEERPLRLRIDRSLAVDNNRTTVVVSISVVITLPNDNRLVVISAVPIPSVVTVTVTIALKIPTATATTTAYLIIAAPIECERLKLPN